MGFLNLLGLSFGEVVFVDLFVLGFEISKHFVGHALKIHKIIIMAKYKSLMVKTSKFNGLETLL